MDGRKFIRNISHMLGQLSRVAADTTNPECRYLIQNHVVKKICALLSGNDMTT